MTSHAKDNDYYEILNISHDASPLDIVKAYRETKIIFQPDSLATYSLYTEDELKAIVAQIEAAYQVLSDSEKRWQYDNHIVPTKKKRKTVHKSILTMAGSETETETETDSDSDKVNPAFIVSTSTHISGALLKEIRESQNISLETIIKSTRISQQYLEAIEADDTTNFPAPTYLISFLKQYAAAIGLDPQLVLKAYDSLNIEPADFSNK